MIIIYCVTESSTVITDGIKTPIATFCYTYAFATRDKAQEYFNKRMEAMAKISPEEKEQYLSCKGKDKCDVTTFLAGKPLTTHHFDVSTVFVDGVN